MWLWDHFGRFLWLWDHFGRGEDEFKSQGQWVYKEALSSGHNMEKLHI